MRERRCSSGSLSVGLPAFPRGSIEREDRAEHTPDKSRTNYFAVSFNCGNVRNPPEPLINFVVSAMLRCRGRRTFQEFLKTPKPFNTTAA